MVKTIHKDDQCISFLSSLIFVNILCLSSAVTMALKGSHGDNWIKWKSLVMMKAHNVYDIASGE